MSRHCSRAIDYDVGRAATDLVLETALETSFLPHGFDTGFDAMLRQTSLSLKELLLLVLGMALTPVLVHADNRPNILWITSEDNGTELGCYGDTYANTPNIDGLASRSLRFKTCWSNAPVCAPARTTIISGMYATSLGGHHMRSGVRLPTGMRLYPQVFRDAGYFCTNCSKTDYNFAKTVSDAGWNENGREAHWRNRPNKETSFFSVFNFTISHESKIRNKPHMLVHDPAQAPVPSYHPDVPEVRRDWAQYYDRLTEMDEEVGGVLAELEEDGLADSTIIFYYGDHGSGMPRSKRWPFDSGLHVPLLVHMPEQFASRAPEGYQAGAESEQVVAFVDLAPTALSMAGIQPPDNMQGTAFGGEHRKPAKEFIFGYRGRMDERIDLVRSCTDGRYVYMRHFYPDRPYLKHVDYMFQTPTTRVWKEMFDLGRLTAVQAKAWKTKPVEEIFDLQSDPDETKNLAADDAWLRIPGNAKQLAKMRAATKQWMKDTLDVGVMPEAVMHSWAGKQAPRSVALKQAKRVQRVVDVAWEATEAWSVCDEMRVKKLIRHSKADSLPIRFWGAHGLQLALQAHGSTMPDAWKQDAYAALAEAVQGPSSGGVAACEGLIESNNAEWKSKAIARLISVANIKQTEDHYTAVEALNVIDNNRAALSSDERNRVESLPTKSDDPPYRADGYVGRLVNTLRRAR
ncbi:MAG: sulfatase [Planctomycetota bacterium]